MTTFDERENSFEARFAHDDELHFKAVARRDRLLGVWAAEVLNLTGSSAADYVKAATREAVAHPGDDAMIAKVMADFKAAGVSTGEGEVRRKLVECTVEAIKQIDAHL